MQKQIEKAKQDLIDELVQLTVLRDRHVVILEQMEEATRAIRQSAEKVTRCVNRLETLAQADPTQNIEFKNMKP